MKQVNTTDGVSTIAMIHNEIAGTYLQIPVKSVVFALLVGQELLLILVKILVTQRLHISKW